MAFTLRGPGGTGTLRPKSRKEAGSLERAGILRLATDPQDPCPSSSKASFLLQGVYMALVESTEEDMTSSCSPSCAHHAGTYTQADGKGVQVRVRNI